jgi:hypothetical protein
VDTNDRFPTSRRWQARWIWAEDAPPRNAWVLFRHEFSLEQAEGLRLFISADTRYRLWLNGQRLGDGPPPSQPFHQFYDEFLLDGVAKAGANCVAVLVHHHGTQPQTRGGMLCEVVGPSGEPVAVPAKHWACRVSQAWRADTHFSSCNRGAPFQEHVDLRRLGDGWTQPGFDAADWARPVEIADRGRIRPPAVMPWCRLIPRDIERLTEREVYAKRVNRLEECLDLANRHRSEDVSISLSQAGRDVDWATAENASALLAEAGVAMLGCSTRHRDGLTDGRYDPCVTLDFGEVLTAYAEMDVEAPEGSRVEIGYAERLVDGRFNNAIECSFGDTFTCRQGQNLFRPLAWRAFRYLRIRVKNAETPVRVRAVRAVEVRYAMEPRGSFSGHERLEQVFALCRRTLELCSVESLMDTPGREQAQWLGDVAAVTAPGLYACFGEAALPGKFLRQSAMNTQPTGLIANVTNVVPPGWHGDIPDYSLWWVIGLWRHYLYTGDARYLHECYPEMQRVMRVHLERLNGEGLVEDMFGWIFIDWADVDRRGACATYNALFAGACDAAAACARVKGDAWAARRYGAAAAGVRSAFAGAFLQPETQVVVDCVADGIRSGKISEHANAAAIAFGCVDDEQAERIVRRVFADHEISATEAQPFFMVVVLEALRRAGRCDLALDFIRERWGRMLDRGQNSCSEEWYVNGSWRTGDWTGFMRTLSHAWSSCAAEFLITGLAGIEIIEPGCGVLRVRPHRADFAYTVVYPTPRGSVRVRWDGRDCRVEAPEGIEVHR